MVVGIHERGQLNSSEAAQCESSGWRAEMADKEVKILSPTRL